jgi:hypothetical protein
LDAKKYIVPGLGDFGCRYFGTLDDWFHIKMSILITNNR